MRESVLMKSIHAHRGVLWAALVLVIASLPGLGADNVATLSMSNGWALAEDAVQGRRPIAEGRVEIRGLGELTFDPSEIVTRRPDVFQSGHFSVFDVLAHVAERGDVEMEYVFDEELQTHRIISLRGLSGWWYDAHYEGGNFDRTVVPMDLFPVKDGMSIVVYLENPMRLEAISEHLQQQMVRQSDNEGAVVIPRVVLQSATATVEFIDVTVVAHNSRSDVFQEGVITVLDLLLSLGDDGLLESLGLQWRPQDGELEIVDGYYVVSIQADGFAPESTGACVLTHQVQGETIFEYLSAHTHTLSHIHLTADLEVLLSPEVVEWLWICL